MTRYIGVGAGCLFLGLIAGRWLAPPKVVEKLRTVTVETRKDESKHVEEKTGNERIREVAGPVVTKTRTVRVVVAGQCQETTEVERTEGPVEKTAEKATTAKAASEERHEAARVVTVEKLRIVESERRWGVGVLGGLGLDGKQHYGGYARARLLGPIEVGAMVDGTSRVGFLTAGVTW